MVDTSDWAGLPDVKIDMGAANALAAACSGAASMIRQQCNGRSTAANTALQDFEGRFSELFTQNQQTANTDGDEIATQLDFLAKSVRAIVDLVPAENKRRQEAREWKKKYDEDKSHVGVSDAWNWKDEDPPEGPTSPPMPKAPAATASPRQTPAEGSGGGGGGTSSARPDKLRGFVSGVSGYIDDLHAKPSQLSNLNNEFTAGFDWGTPGPSGVDGSALYSAFTTYNDLNHKDKTWVNTVAHAFEQAGGSHGMVTLSNGALATSLHNAGVRVSRADIPVGSPRLYGISATTGYSDDPVNAGTGNFVEPETDLEFGGGCVGLALTRMYNSFNTGTAAFGPGWSSWTEVALHLDDEAALFTHPDGRVSLFPRMGDGWDRATGESLWLERDEQAGEMRVTDNDGGTWRFTRSGAAISHDRGEGTMVSFVREDDRLVRLVHELGRSVTLEWDGDLVVEARASDGRTTTYAYDGGRLVSATGSKGTRSYRWNDSGLISAVVDGDGVVEVENTYDDEGRVTTQLAPTGRVSRYTYLPGHVTEVADLDGDRSNTWVHDDRGRLIGLIDSEGNRHSTAYDVHGNAVMNTERDGAVTVKEYDDRGHVVREVAPSGTDLGFEYDEHDRLVRVVLDDGVESRCSYEGASRNPSVLIDPEGGETRFEWHTGQVSRVVDPTGVELRMEHDRFGHLVAVTNAHGDTARLEYDAAGRTTAAITPGGNRTTYVYGPAGLSERHDPDGAVWRYERTAAGRLTTVTDPTGGVTTVEYGAGGDEVSRVDPLGRSVQRRLDDLGNLASIELPDGEQWRFTHDGLSRLTSTTSPDGATWTRRYDAVGQLVEMVAPTGDRVSITTDRASGTTVTSTPESQVVERVDGLGRALSAEGSDGAAAIATYDRCGRVVEQLDGEGGLTRIERDAGGRPVAVTSPTGETTRYEYDACGRRSAVVDPVGARTSVEYDADSRPVRVVLPTGEVAWTRYDECGRVAATFRPGAGLLSCTYDLAGRLVETWDSADGLRRFAYDPAGQLVAATDGNGGTTRYEYDARGRVVLVVDPLGNETRREFDEMDRCVAETDPLGRTTRAGYDVMGRQTWQEDAQGHRTEWTYDAAGEVSGVSRDGVPLARITRDPRARTLTLVDTTRTDGTTVVHEARWNRRGQLVSRSRDGRTMRWSYDASGRRESMTLPEGQQVDYSYDAAGRVVAVEHPLLGRATMERDAAGRVVSATAGDLIQAWTYADGFVVSHSSTDRTGASRTEVRRDDEGRIREIERDGEVTSYDYDEACQLVEAATGGDSVRWHYDACGRMVRESGPAGSRELSYDAGSQLVLVVGPEGSTRHEYDEIGRRTRTTYADGRTRDLGWSPTGWLASVVDEVDGRTSRTELHVDASAELASIDDTPVFWDSENAYAPPLAQIGAAPVLPLGPVSAVGEQWVSPGWRGSRAEGVDAWSVLGAAVSGLPEGVGVSPAGQLTLGDLEWLGRRVYDAGTRGFLSVDPLDPVTGAGWSGNPYSYAGNDPLHALDPTGLKPVSEADLHAAQPMYERAWDATKKWVDENTDYIIGGALAAAGVAALFIPVPVLGQALGGALISAGVETISQRAAAGKDGQLNVSKIVVAGAAGAIGGGSGAAFKAAGMTTAQTLVRTAGVDAVTGGAQEFTNYAFDHKGKFDLGEAGLKTLQGSGSSLIGSGVGAPLEPLKNAAGAAAVRNLADVGATDATKLTVKQWAGKSGAELGVDMVKSAESNIVSQPLTTGDFDPSDFGKKLAEDGGKGVLKSFGHGTRTVSP